MLMKTATQSLTEQLAGLLAERIRTRLLSPGARLASVRECARQQGVSPSTVVAAYDQLLAQGLVEARRNRGFFVRDRGGRGSEPPSVPESVALTAGECASPAASGECGGADPRHVPFGQRQAAAGHGRVSPDWLEGSFMAVAMRKVTGTQALREFTLQYGEPAGDPGLRRSLSQKLASLHVPATPDQIITTVGATHALDVVSRTMLRAGDR
jgi:DNA-binding transcriptional MocR family regulator